MSLKFAGTLKNCFISKFMNSFYAVGFLEEDLNGEHFSNLSGMDVRTSDIQSLTYHEEIGMTQIQTLNSIYMSEGNLIDKFFPSIKGGIHVTKNLLKQGGLRL